MTVVATKINNEEIYLDSPAFMVMECEEDVPADMLTLVFFTDKKLDEFKYIKLYHDENLIFNGIVDNQIFTLDENGKYVKLNVRSMAGLLLDNEAMPQVYNLPSITTIFNRHIKPYGFLGLIGADSTTAKEYTVLKGMSEWEALYKFCTEILNTVPIVTPENYIDIRKNKFDLNSPLKISSKGKHYCYSYSLEENINRYNQVSHVYVRVKNEGLYSEVLEDEDALKRGIQRKRYLNLVGDSNPTLSNGEAKISSFKKQSYRIKLKVDGYVDAKVGMQVELDDDDLGQLKNLVISKIKYKLNSSKDVTEITLRREK